MDIILKHYSKFKQLDISARMERNVTLRKLKVKPEHELEEMLVKAEGKKQSRLVTWIKIAINSQRSREKALPLGNNCPIIS